MAEDIELLRLRAKAKLRLQQQQAAAMAQEPPREPIVVAGESKSDEPKEEAGLGAKALDLGLRGLDFVGGLARTSAAGLTDLGRVAGQVPEAIQKGDPGVLTEFQTATRPGDVTQALQGRAPGSAEFLERAGVPEGQQFDILPEGTKIPLTNIDVGTGTTSARDIAGFGLDVATDPLSLLTGGQTGAIRAAATPLKSATRTGGKKLFKSAFKKLDEVAARKGKQTPPSDVLLKHGIAGSNKAVEEKTFKLLGQLKGQRDSMLDAAEDAGAFVDVKEAVKPVKEKIEQIKKGRNAFKKDIAQSVERQVKKIEKSAPKPEQILRRKVPGKKASAMEKLMGVKDQPATFTEKVIPAEKPLSLMEASDIKTSIRDAIGDSAFDQTKKTTLGQSLLLDLGRGFQESVEKSANRAVPGLGDSIKATNDELGTLLTVRQTLTKEAEKAGRKNLFTSVDGALLLGAPGAFLGKKGADVLKTTGFRSRTGKLLNQLGRFGEQSDVLSRMPGVDTVLRQSAVEQFSPERQQQPSAFTGLGR